MKFSAPQSSLAAALAPLSTVVPQKSPMPVLSHFLADLKGNTLTLTGSDIEVTMQTEIEVQGQKDGRTLLPSRKFLDLMRGLPDVTVSIEANKEHRITITDTEGKKYQCAAESVDVYPQVPQLSETTTFKMPRSRLRRMITKVLFAVSRDELRPQLTGVFLELSKDHFRLVSTDGHRLVKIGTKSNGFKGDTHTAIVPAKAMQAVQRIAEGEGDIEIGFAGSQLGFRAGNTTLITRLIEGRYPNYDAVIPTENKQVLTVGLDQLTSAVRRANIFSNEISRQIRVHLEKQQMQIKVEDIEQGNEGFETIACEFTGDPMDIGYNASYVEQMLRQIDTPDVRFELGSSTSAGIVRPTEQEENEDLLMLIMPVRLS
ncbi:DNA polymerase III subunit beta [bacterium]|nr:DNA polymerase III subunit beta [bacterium]